MTILSVVSALLKALRAVVPKHDPPNHAMAPPNQSQTQGSENNSSTGVNQLAGNFLSQSIQALRQRPSFLAVFCICALAVVYGFAKGGQQYGFGLLVLLLIGLAVVAAIILIGEKPTQEIKLSGNVRIDSHLVSLGATMRSAARIKNKMFVAKAEARCAMVDNLMSDLGNGILRISAREYNGTIIELLENAQRTVFCVQNGKSLEHWSRFLSDDILQAHAKSQATVVRIFVFDTQADVKPHHLTEIEKNIASKKVQVLMYFDKLDKVYEWPLKHPREYYIIDDGEAIGFTEDVTDEGFYGTWVFDHAKKATDYNNQFAQLKARSKSYEDVKALLAQNVLTAARLAAVA